MHPGLRLAQQHACRITLFTRPNCGLCTRAKSVLSHVWDSRPFVFSEIDIIRQDHPKAQAWRNLYDIDVPVIHISKSSAPEEEPRLASKAVKLMHSFDPEDVQAQMDRVENA